MRVPSMAMFLAWAVGCGGATEFNAANSNVRTNKQKDTASTATATDDGGASVDPTLADRLEKSFAVSEIQKVELSADANLGSLSQELRLEYKYTPAVRTFTQIDRPIVTKILQQGSAGKTISQSFAQIDRGILDIVLVIDNSGSMSDEQAKVAANLMPLLDQVKNTDWRINIVTTDPKSGCSRALIKKDDPDAATVFSDAVKAGLSGDGNEQGIRMAVAGLDAGRKPSIDSGVGCTMNTSWLRPDSSVAVLIVSDEDNCSSNGSGCSGKAWNTHTYLVNYLTNTLGRPVGSQARIYGIYWQPGTTCSGGSNQATQYHAAVMATSGTFGSICDASYLTTLQRISLDMSAIVKNQFTLSNIPDSSSLTVKVNNAVTLENTDWTVSGTTLTFKSPPPAGATISTGYKVGETARFSTIELGAKPAPATLRVIVNGDTIAASLYSIDTNNVLKFATQPADLANISVSFRTQVDLVSEFNLGSKAKDGALKVTVGEATVSNFTYDASGKIVFATPPEDGAKITVEYDEQGDKILSYPLALTGEGIREVNVVDAVTGASVDTSYADGILTVAETEHSEGRLLRILYRTEGSGPASLELEHAPLSGSLEAKAIGMDCELGKGIIVVEKKIVINCAFQAASTVNITYSYRTPTVDEFMLDGVAKPDEGFWTVKIDGVETKEFERTGNKIRLLTPPDPAATVTVAYGQREAD